MAATALNIDGLLIRQLAPGDAAPLAAFYNGLSADAIRTFRPISYSTTKEVCQGIVQGNLSDEKHDLVAVHGERIVGWSFIWSLSEEQPTFGLGVADAYQRQGLGTALMEGVLEVARQRRLPDVFLTVVQENKVAWNSDT